MADEVLSDLLGPLVTSMMGRVEVASRVEIVSFDRATCTADVREVVRRTELDASGEIVAQEPPILRGLPVVFPGGGGRSLTWGMEAGDRAVLVVMTRSHDEANSLETAGPLTPASSRLLSLTDGVVIPMIGWPKSPPPTHPDGEPCLSLPTGEALHVGTLSPSLRLAIAEEVRSHLVDLKSWLDTHTHPTPSGASSAPTTASPAVPAIGTLASGRIRVDT